MKETAHDVGGGRLAAPSPTPTEELPDLLHKEPTKIKVDGVNLTYDITAIALALVLKRILARALPPTVVKLVALAASDGAPPG